MDWGFWKDFRAARIHQFSWKFCLPAPVFLSGTPFSGLADLLGHLQCSRLPWEPENCCYFHIVFLVFPHRMVLALIFPPLQSTAVALQLLSDFFCSPYESHRNTWPSPTSYSRQGWRQVGQGLFSWILRISKNGSFWKIWEPRALAQIVILNFSVCFYFSSRK